MRALRSNPPGPVNFRIISPMSKPPPDCTLAIMSRSSPMPGAGAAWALPGATCGPPKSPASPCPPDILSTPRAAA